MSKERLPMGPGKAAAAYGRALAKLEPIHPWHFFAITEHVRHIRRQAAGERHKLKDEQRITQLLRIELEEANKTMITEAQLAEAWNSGYWHGTSHTGPLNDAAIQAKNPHKEEDRGALAKEHAAASNETPS